MRPPLPMLCYVVSGIMYNQELKVCICRTVYILGVLCWHSFRDTRTLYDCPNNTSIPPPFVIATQKYQINTVPTPTVA